MDDLISRQAAIDLLSFEKEMLNRVLNDTDVVGVEREKFSWGLGLIESNIKDIEELPSAERRGRWENIEHAPDGLMYVTCSECGKRQTVEFTSYCGNCGAKMEEIDE